MPKIIFVDRKLSTEYIMENRQSLYAPIFPHNFSGKDVESHVDLDSIFVLNFPDYWDGNKMLMMVQFGQPRVEQCLSVTDLLAIKSNVSVAEYTHRWGGAELIGWKSATVCLETGECWVPKLCIRDKCLEVIWFVFFSSRDPEYRRIEEKTVYFKYV